MSEFERSKVSTENEIILRKKFGNLYNWEKPQIQQTVGPFIPTALDEFSERRDFLLNEAHRALQTFSTVDVALLYDRKLPDPDGKRSEWDKFIGDEIGQHSRETPNWLIGGFGHPDYQADFEYWGKMSEYDLHEALMLSVGIEPKNFGEQRLKHAEKQMEKITLIAPVEFIVRRHEQFFRKYPSGMNGKVRASPSFLYDWFTDIELSVHPRFLEVLHNRVQSGRKTKGAAASIEVAITKTE